MRVRFRVPVTIYTSGSTADDTQLAGRFEQDTLRVTYGFSGAAPSLQVPPEGKFIKQFDTLVIDIEDSPGTTILAGLVAAAQRASLLQLMVDLANRVIFGVRNFGIVPHLREIRPVPGMTDQYIRRWKAEAQTEGGEFVSILPDEGLVTALSDALLRNMETRSGELERSRWPSIVEAVERQQTAAPEQEFATNAIEHAQSGNLRLAIVESVVCLEIVVTQYLKLLLERRGLSKKRMRVFANPQIAVGIHSRVAYLLELAGMRLDNPFVEEVLDTIGWRNTIAHRTGALPEGKTEEQIRSGIIQVLTLASLLGVMRDEIAGGPMMREIGERVAADLGGRSLSRLGPVLKARGHHQVFVEFSYLVPGDMPAPDQLESMVEVVSRRIKERDPDFSKDRHLFVRFVVLPNRVKGYWYQGRLTIPPE